MRSSPAQSVLRAACVEVAAGPAAVLVRDSKNPGGPRLGLAPGAWGRFVAYAAR
ncbi:DUF397 domain-containing protein [Streptomyces sp. SID3212]|uniref:DUF397 domain-containing protein n=1 Tax=Streptomyces sp. SID3212 TaxID=2690259 RepID=UPI00136CA33D|nr:DUF397 domain-containing protein [Streptomyces sp. SID3212]